MVKIPEPITAPMPSDVRLSQPSDFFKFFAGLFRIGNQLIDILGAEELCAQSSPSR